MTHPSTHSINNPSPIETDEISLKELIQKIQEWIQYLKTQWKLIMGIADAKMSVDGREIYHAKDLRVGLFTSTDNF